MKALPQPLSLARISASTRQKSALLNVTSPAQSIDGASSRLDSGTRHSVIAAVAAPTGTFRKKIHSQPAVSVRIPPTGGPTATANPVVAPQMPNAVPRSMGGNTWASSASEVANIIAPPSP
jgi:hypothetical protein